MRTLFRSTLVLLLSMIVLASCQQDTLETSFNEPNAIESRTLEDRLNCLPQPFGNCDLMEVKTTKIQNNYFVEVQNLSEYEMTNWLMDDKAPQFSQFHTDQLPVFKFSQAGTYQICATVDCGKTVNCCKDIVLD